MTDYSAVVVGIPTLDQPLNEALEHTSSKLDKDPYLSRLRNLFIYLAYGVAFLTSVFRLPYVAIRDLQDRVTNCEHAVISQVNNLAEQVDELKVGAGSISQRLDRAEGKLRGAIKINDGLSGIVGGLNKGRMVEEYRTALEALYEQSLRL